MNNKIFLYLMIVWSTAGFGQQSFFLDSLFRFDLSDINTVELQYQKSEMERLRHNGGISAGVNITDSFQEEINVGLSTRVFVKANLLSGGYHDNLKDAKIIQHQIQIDRIKGIDRAIAHNYGIYFDYVIYLYNQEKMAVIDRILAESSQLKKYYQRLYYNKMIDYSEILSIANTSDQYTLLQQSQKRYNDLFDQMIIDTLLPRVSTDSNWEIDFEGIYQSLDHDTSSKQVLLLKNEMLDIADSKDRTPTLSIAGGYDIARDRPYFGVSLTTKITSHKKQNLEAKRLQLQNDHRQEQLQKKKEILNLQYEYYYKEKQIRGLHMKRLSIEEEERKYSVKRAILSLEESIQERKLNLQRQLVKYELADLRQQQMLLLLHVKKLLLNLPLAPYIKAKKIHLQSRKYAGNRYILLESDKEFSAFELHFLEQNEIRPLRPIEVVSLDQLEVIRPEKYDTRVEMESAILGLVEQGNETNFLIDDLQSLKRLELRTLAQKDFDFTAASK